MFVHTKEISLCLGQIAEVSSFSFFPSVFIPFTVWEEEGDNYFQLVVNLAVCFVFLASHLFQLTLFHD